MIKLFNITRKLSECNSYIQQLEAQNKLLHENLLLSQQTEKTSDQKKYAQHKASLLRPIHEMADFIGREFEFRHNVVRDSYEYRPRNDRRDWQPVGERQLNTIMNSVQDDGGVLCLKSLVVQRIKSMMACDYHPVQDYLNGIRGMWDGRNRIDDLARRINQSDYCRRMLHVWLLAMVAQWLGLDVRHANAVMLLLVSPRQGLHKSTFLHELLPDALTSYYTDDFTLASRSNAERKLVEFALINIDEFDKLPARKQPELKTLMQTLRPSFVKAYKNCFNQLPRIASFVGTTNQRHVLTDRTGSRRFLILEPEDMIRIGDIEHDQLYAQLLHEIESGHRFYFTKEEEAEIQAVNQAYYQLDAVEQLFTRFYRKPSNGEASQSLYASQLMEFLRRRDAKTLRMVSETAFAKMLVRLGFTPEHHHNGNIYRVVAL
jgi:predicted P-loop ATPase